MPFKRGFRPQTGNVGGDTRSGIYGAPLSSGGRGGRGNRGRGFFDLPVPPRRRGRSVPTVPWAEPARRVPGEIIGWLVPDWWQIVEIGLQPLGDEWAIQQPDGWQVPAGWTQCATPDCADVWGAPDVGVWASASACTAQAACPTAQAGGVWPTTRRLWGNPHPTRLVVLGYVHTSGNLTDATFRGTIVAQFLRANAGVTTMPEFAQAKAQPLPFLLPPAPWFDPLVEVQAQVEADVKAQPAVSPYAQAAVQYKVRPRAEPGGRGGRIPPHRDDPRTGTPPVRGPEPVVVPRLPPRANVKERKRGVPPWAHAAVGAFTEAVDFLGCVEAAQGRRLRGGQREPGLSYHQKLGDRIAGAAEHADQTDMWALAECMRNEGASDLLIGKVNRAVNRAMAAARKSGYAPDVGRGYGSGPHDAGHWGARF